MSFCRAVFTVLPHFVLRYRKMKPKTAKKVLLATHGGLSLELCATLFNISPMAVYRLVCAFGRTCLVTLLTRCYLPLPDYFIVDEKHTHCKKERVYLPTIVCGRVIWHLSSHIPWFWLDRRRRIFDHRPVSCAGAEYRIGSSDLPYY